MTRPFVHVLVRPTRLRSAVLVLVWLLVLAQAAAAAQDALRITVWKKRHRLEVLRGGRVVHSFHVSLGIDPVGPKETRGDGKTPVGTYIVYDKRPSERFRWFLALNYPHIEDANRAFAAGRISADTWADIWLADKMHETPPWDTPLGGFVGIHGTGAERKKAKQRQVSDWTDGCVALSDSDMDELYVMTPIGTEVQIRE